MKTEQPVKCPYCGHIFYSDFNDNNAYVPQVECCAECEQYFAVQLVMRYEVQTQALFDTPAEPPTPEAQEPEKPAAKTPVKAVRIRLTREQRAVLEPFLEELRQVQGTGKGTVTVGQLDPCFLDEGYKSAYFVMLNQEIGWRVTDALKPALHGTRLEWAADQMEEEPEPFD